MISQEIVILEKTLQGSVIIREVLTDPQFQWGPGKGIVSFSACTGKQWRHKEQWPNQKMISKQRINLLELPRVLITTMIPLLTIKVKDNPTGPTSNWSTDCPFRQRITRLALSTTDHPTDPYGNWTPDWPFQPRISQSTSDRSSNDEATIYLDIKAIVRGLFSSYRQMIAGPISCCFRLLALLNNLIID